MTWNQKKKKDRGLEKQSNLIFKNKTWSPEENPIVLCFAIKLPRESNISQI